MINIKKSKAPQEKFNYNDDDIIEQIQNDFFKLCYICEEYTPRHFEIEHFYPQKYFSEKENSYNNLFYSCQKCNKIKPKNLNTEGEEILNCCEDDVEKLLILRYLEGKNKIEITSPDKEVLKIKNTIKLLNRIYNGIGTTSKDYTSLRYNIKKEIKNFNKLLEKYEKNKLFESFIKKQLSKKTKSEESSFVSFKRQIIKENTEYKHFEKYFD